MAEKKRDDEIFDELADAASLFEEIDGLPQREDIGDILFVEGIEDDESVVDEDLTGDEETGVPQKPEKVRPVHREPVVAEEAVTIADKLAPRRRPLARRKREIPVEMEPVSAPSPTNGLTIGEFFAPLVRHSPADKIRVEADTIGSVFQGFIR